MIGKEYTRLRENARTAVLFCHGILGTPEHFRELIPLVPEEFSIHNLVLDGHGKGARDFSKTSMKKWEAQVDSAVSSLCETHDNIIIVGHSMGTLLALDLSLRYSDKVKLLFLENVPLTPFTRPSATRHSYRVLFEKVREDRPDEVAARDAYGIEVDRRLWLYVGWAPRFIELFRKAAGVTRRLSQVSVRCICFQSKHDELVSNQSERILRRHRNIITHTLKNSSHYLYTENDRKLLRDTFSEECAKFLDEDNTMK